MMIPMALPNTTTYVMNSMIPVYVESCVSRSKRATLRFMVYGIALLFTCSTQFVFGQTIGQACVACHSNAQPLKDQSQIGLRQASLFLGLESDLSSSPKDSASDVHARAVGKIWEAGKLSPAFASILKKLDISEGSVEFSNNCLTCHAGVKPEASVGLLPGRSIGDLAADRQSIAGNSIGCEACHGGGQKYYLEHLSPKWFALSVSQKEAYGFHDLQNQAVAAEVCLSCHLGNPKESKVLTHQMYAAGHPPLPPFDLAKFLQQTCKKHWLELDEKSEQWSKDPDSNLEIRLSYLRNHFRPNEGKEILQSGSQALQEFDSQIQSHFQRTQQSMIGQAVSSVMAHDLMLHNANSEQSWGDYAVYDCVGCHQTLYKDIRGSFSQSGRVPGRPQGMLWTKPTEITTKRLELGELIGFQGGIDNELNKTPFGSMAGIQKVYQDYPAKRIVLREMMIRRADHALNYTQADQWIHGYLRERRDAMGNEWVAKQVFWTLEAYFGDLERFNKQYPSVDLRDLRFMDRFKQVAIQAPPVSEVVSCNGKGSQPSMEKVAFYKQLQSFVEEFLGSQF